ncbi:MAG: MFS transporter [Parcubacteria group bacterium]|nr:MFS transporter [Parcubacteria group bacterium]
MKQIFWKFFPFWIFLIFFKFGGGLHYALISPLGEKFLPLWLVGALMGGSSLVQLLLDVPAGHMLDRYGYLRFLKITTFLFLIAALFISYGLTINTYLWSLFFSIFGWLFFGSGVNAYILSHAPRDSAGKFISLRDVAGSIGMMLGSAALPFVLLLAPHYNYMGYVIGVFIFIAFVVLFFSPKDRVSVHTETKLPTQHHYIRRHFIHTTIKAMKHLNPASGTLIMLDLAGSIFYGVIWFVVPLVIAHQADAKILGLGLGIFDLAVVALGFLLGSLADKADKRTLVFFGLLIFSISGMLLGLNFGWLFLLFGFLATTGDEMAGLSLWSWLHSLDREHANDGVIASVIGFFQDLGWAIGPVFAGIMYGLVGPSITIILGAIPILVIWLIYQIKMKEHHPEGGLSFALIPRKPHRARHKT